MNASQDISEMERLLHKSTPEEIRARLAAAIFTRNFLQETPDAVRLVGRKKKTRTRTMLPTDEGLPEVADNNSRFGLRQGGSVGAFRLICDISGSSDGTLWLVKENDEDGPPMVLRVLGGNALSDEERSQIQSRSERLKLIHHTQWARVLHAGTTDDGLVFRVDEYLSGKPIGQFCDNERLRIEERVRLFRQVCHAVSDLHSLGHSGFRLSSANALVSFEMNRACVRIADMRAEHSVNPTGDDPTGVTNDIRDLGLMLLELLVGMSSDDYLAAASEAAPTRPSQLLRTQCFAFPGIARKRSAEPGEIINTVSGRLDAAVMKSLASDPDHQYACVPEFSEDLREFLAMPPAAGDGWFRRLFARRKSN